MAERRHSILRLILVPAIISNLVTFTRLGLELAGFPWGQPTQLAWWVSLSLLIPVFGIYFAYALRNDPHPFKRLALTLFVYALTVRIPTAILYWISGVLGWSTHYSQYGPPGQDAGYLMGGLLPQLVFWPLFTVVAGFLCGLPLLTWFRSKRPRPASA
jgi:peptidoglycan biosynthesis protein MviN/MurJ (putative lipid II flippase)